MSRVLTGRWVGIDRSRSELALAAARGARPLVVADAVALPAPSAGFDTVLCTMGLMLFEPLDPMLAEIARLLRPRGRLVALLPSTKPLRLRDRARYLGLLVALRRRLTYPNDRALSRPDTPLRRAGLFLADDRTSRFDLTIDSDEIADLFVRSLYLPGAKNEHIEAAAAVARRWVGTTISIPLRRVVAERE